MTRWRFLAFQYSPTSRPLDEWQEGLEIDSFNRFSDILERLQVLPREQWRRPDFDVLHGDSYRGMGEIRFKADRKVHRVFGWFGPSPMRFTFTLLHGCLKQRSDLTPEYELSRKRRDLVIAYGNLMTYDFALKKRPPRKPEG
jgi:hypothetical protein